MKINVLLLTCAFAVSPAGWASNCPVLIGQIDVIL